MQQIKLNSQTDRLCLTDKMTGNHTIKHIQRNDTGGKDNVAETTLLDNR